jgi:phosphoribosyl 1,2-cyclic phosphodiesterase
MSPLSIPDQPRGLGRAVTGLYDSAGRAAPVCAPLPVPRRVVGPVAGGAEVAGGSEAELVVLASSSAGNSSALIVGSGRMRRVTLIDGGLSPRRTMRCLAALGLGPEHLDRIVFTHLDRDHAHDGWIRGLPRHAEFVIHAKHRARAERMGMLVRRTSVFDSAFDLPTGVRVDPVLAAHDDLGVVAFRFELPGSAASPATGPAAPAGAPRTLGYATDLGRVPGQLIELFRGVDVLAIESNYCPLMQAASDRPDFLKRRIMDGGGHLSNEQCAEAVAQIAPRQNVVLLHLSRQCNTPCRARSYHEGAPYELAVSDWAEPIPAITIGRCHAPGHASQRLEV